MKTTYGIVHILLSAYFHKYTKIAYRNSL